MFKKNILITLLFLVLVPYSNLAYAEDTEPSYTQLREVDKGTFNEYRYRITDEFFNLRNKYEINGKVDTISANKILELAKKGYNYLPDSLSNKNYYNHLKTSIEKGIKYPLNASNYTSILGAIENYLEKTNIKSIKGTVEAFPKEGNAPLTVTLRGNVKDPTGTKIPSYKYTWWMHENGKRKILGDNISLRHIFKEEGNFSIFLDVSSSHKNNGGYTDVLSFSSRADIKVKEKIASVIIKVNSTTLRNNNELKFTPSEASYGLLFDATSSTPTSGSEFIKTTWDFGNGITKTYRGNPKVERVIYAKEGEYSVSLKLQTNELKTVERKFDISVHDPIATIKPSSEEGFMGDKFTFSSQKTGNDKNLSYAWEIIDLEQDKVIFRKAGTLFTYIFKNKGKYNVKMKVTEPSGETDVDSQIIYINSRAPTAEFSSNIPFTHKPNKVFFDATKSFDPDFSDDGKLKYTWIINGDRVLLDEPNHNGSTGYFTFDSIGEHSVTLEVEDPDNISSIKKEAVDVKSILSVEFFAFPRVAQRENTLRFVSSSPEAKFYEWDFGDGITKGGKDANISHIYKKSGIFNVKLQVRDINDKINYFEKNVYIGDSNSPYSFISITDNSQVDVLFDKSSCKGKGAYIVNRVDSVLFSGKESIDVTGENSGLTYSWKLGKQSYKDGVEFTKKFDELGCFPIKLTVTSDESGKTHSSTSYVEVKNIKPNLSSLDVRIVNDSTDPVIVNVTALGAKDKDGVIQSYLWYYYTDIDSEPQDFRATKSPSTSFVLPKVTGNYYFVVVMKDNNEAKSNSEDITGSKYFMTLTGDNLNTPLVKLKINDSSISIGDEAIFTANTENILGQNLTNKVKYSWDFDGDGFYEEETTSNTVTYKYVSSGEMHAKVKAKYKGFSNTKTVTVDVSNVLKPDFGYISIGNNFIFFYNGLGTADSYEWNLGDKKIITNKKYFVYEYSDGLTSHLVNLKIGEGTKFKSIEKKVIKNVKNIILARKNGLVLFSDPKISTENEIILEKQGDNAFIYLGESKKDIVNFVIDYDINYDSNLNGGNDDDEDNLKLDSYNDGSLIKVELNNSKFQKIRVFIKNSEGNIVDSKDITIIKNYIKEAEIDINKIAFTGISESIKFKIEKLKNYVDGLPKEHKLKASMYIQKLQEEWNDDRARANVILEFEGFIGDTGVDNSEEIINILEGIFVENQEDKSDKAITYNALKALIPSSIICKNNETLEEILCYDSMIAKLDAIKNNDNIDENKVLGVDILKIIASDKIMTTKQKNDFKAILKSFVYGGVVNIPEEEKEEIKEPTSGDGSSILSLIYSIFKWIFIIILVLIGFILFFYLYYLFANKDKNIGFQDFIIEKTSGEKKKVNKTEDTFEEDILSDLKEETVEDDKIESEKQSSIDTREETFDNKKIKEEVKEETKEVAFENEEVKEEAKTEDVPDWLKGSFGEDTEEETKFEVDSKEEKTEKKEKVEDEKTKEVAFKKEEVKEEAKTEDVPDWLKGSFGEETKEETKSDTNSKEEKTEKKEKVEDEKTKEVAFKKEEVKEEAKTEDVPDWLKGSFGEDAKEETKSDVNSKKEKTERKEKVEDKKIKEVSKKESSKEKTEDMPDWLKGSFSDEIKEEAKSELESKEEKIEKPENVEEKKIEKIKREKVKETPKKEADDNMPDWLKGSFSDEVQEKEIKSEDVIKKSTNNKNTKEVKKVSKEEDNIPDWLKGSFSEETKDETKSNIDSREEEKKFESKEKLKEVKVKKEITKPVRKEPIKKVLKKEVEMKGEVKKETTKSKVEKKKEVQKKETKTTEKETNKTNTKEEKKPELWDDGMKVPDWLKSDDEK